MSSSTLTTHFALATALCSLLLALTGPTCGAQRLSTNVLPTHYALVHARIYRRPLAVPEEIRSGRRLLHCEAARIRRRGDD